MVERWDLVLQMLQELRKELNEFVDELDRRFEAVNQRLDKIESTQESMLDAFEQRRRTGGAHG